MMKKAPFPLALAGMMASAVLSAALGTARAAPTLSDLPADPLGSPMWEYHAARLFAGAPVVFDDRVRVSMPRIAENQRVFPVAVDARGLPGVVRILLLADLNPIPVAVDYAPRSAAAYIATRVKLDQRTPLRAAVLTSNGTWHLGGQWIDAAGGGCSAPPVSRVRGDWADHLGELRGAAWAEGAAATRLRISLRHPMDTGLVENIPAYNIEHVAIQSADGRALADLKVFGAVAEDPAFTLIVEPTAGPLRIAARDTAGLEFAGAVAPPGAPRIASASAALRR